MRALSASLQSLAGVKSLSDFTPQTKRVVVEYEVGLVSLTQLVAAVAMVPSCKPLHGEPYAASVLLKVKGLTAENATAVEQALKRVKGVANAKANPADGTVTVDLVVPKPEDAEKPDVSLDRLIGAVEGATGLSVEG